jgi:hypothetical protein
MALVSTLIGSTIGFVSFLVAMFVYQTGFLLALAVYSGSGICVAMACIVVAIASKSVSHPAMEPARS